MERPKRRLWPWALVLALGACVSLEEMHIPKGSVHRDQRTLVAVFGGPGAVMTVEENKAEALGGYTPLLSIVVQGAENERDLSAAKDLAQYLPPFDVGAEFTPIVMKSLAGVGHPGTLLSPDDAGVPPEQMARFNKASDIMDWRLHYFLQNPEYPVPRNYESLLQLNDGLVLEIDVAYGLSQDDQQNATPTLASVLKLYRVDGMHLLWRHENSVADKAGAALVYDFKKNSDDLIAKYRKLMPALAKSISDDYHKELSAAGLLALPKPAAATSNAAPAGWYAAPDLPTLSTAAARGTGYRHNQISVSTAAAAPAQAPTGWYPAPDLPTLSTATPKAQGAPVPAASLPGMTVSTTTAAAAAPTISTTTTPPPAIEVPPLLQAPPP